MILADKIIELRKKAGYSQEELAEKMGVSRQSVSKWEGALSIPDLDKILLMSDIFGVSTDYLLKDELGDEIPAPKEEISESHFRKVSMEEANANMLSEALGEAFYGFAGRRAGSGGAGDSFDRRQGQYVRNF